MRGALLRLVPRRWLPAWLSFLIVAAVSIGVWANWAAAGWKLPTGDEPHYLVLARSLASGSVDPSASYLREFERRDIYPPGLAPPGSALTAANSHSVAHAGGRVSIHAPGLPALIALPYAIAGMTGARLVLSLLAATAIFALVLFAQERSADRRKNALAAFGLVFAQPVLLGGGQIYPDLAAGVLLLWCLVAANRPRLAQERGWLGLVALMLALLPWLHLKFVPAAVIVAIYAAARCWHAGAGWRAALLPVPLCVSLGALSIWHLVQFGQLSGPYGGDALVFSGQALMVLLGLIADQNQGLLVSHPLLLLAGLVALPLFYSRDRGLFCVWLAVLLSVMVPNAMHPNWYGGWSFSGRFGWTAGVLLALPAMVGLVRLGMGPLLGLVGLSVVLQGFIVWQNVANDLSLYNRPAQSHLFQYPIQFPDLAEWLPAFYNVDWAFGHRPNLLWLLALAALPALGLVLGGRGRRGAMVGAGLIAVLGIAFVSLAAQRHVHYGAGRMAAQTGRFTEGVRRVEAGVDAPGFAMFGPYDTFRPGYYSADLSYEVAAGGDTPPGVFEVVDSGAQSWLGAVPLASTSGAHVATVTFRVPPGRARALQFRVPWAGHGRLVLRQVRVFPVPAAQQSE